MARARIQRGRQRHRLSSVATRIGSVLIAPLAPLFGLVVAYLTYHPPRRRRPRAPSAFALRPADVTVGVGPARSPLHAWLLAGDPDRVVVLGHGMGLDKSSSLAQAQLVHQAGYTVVLFDFRNHGASFRDRGVTRFSHRFNDDLVAVVDHVRAMPEHARARIAVWGLSFSTFPVVHTLPRLAGRVQAVVCDSGPTLEVSAIVRNFLHSGIVPVPGALRAAPARTLWSAVFARVAVAILAPPADWPPAAQRDGVAETPMLFVIGDQDAIAPVEEVRALARRYPRAEVMVVPGAGHLRAVKTDKSAYTTTVLDFLARGLGRPLGRPTAGPGR